MKHLLLITSVLIANTAMSQISLQAGAGIAYKQTPTMSGNLSVNYRYKQIESGFSMLHLPFQKASYFGINSGYVLTSGDWELKPYAGINNKLTGSTHTQDRYVHDGTTQILSQGNEVNEWKPSFGMMIIKGVAFFDVGYMENFNVSLGLRYTFKN